MSEDNPAFQMFAEDEDLTSSSSENEHTPTLLPRRGVEFYPSDDDSDMPGLGGPPLFDESNEEEDDDDDDDMSGMPGMELRPLAESSDDDSEDTSEDTSDDDDDGSTIPQLVHRLLSFGSSSSDEGSDSDDDEGEVVHYGVSCDECGASPICGNLYHSTRIVDYDICQECYEENHKDLTMADAFAVIKRRRRFREEEYFGEDFRLMRRDCFEWEDLETELRQNNQVLQNLDINFNQVLFGRPFGFQQPADRTIQISPESMEFVSQSMANSTKLRVIYAALPANHHQEYQDALAAFFRGIAASQTIITLCITMDIRWESAAQSICELISTNKTIRFLFLRQKYSPEIDGGLAGAEAPEVLNRHRKEQTRAAAAPFFQALEHSSLHLFMCGGVDRLGEDCRTAAIHALRTRPCLKRIKASFENEEDRTLQDLMDQKQQHWMKDWNDPEASNESRVQILEEIMSCKQVEEQDQVAALFHFVRSNPGALPV